MKRIGLCAGIGLLAILGTVGATACYDSKLNETYDESITALVEEKRDLEQRVAKKSGLQNYFMSSSFNLTKEKNNYKMSIFGYSPKNTIEIINGQEIEFKYNKYYNVDVDIPTESAKEILALAKDFVELKEDKNQASYDIYLQGLNIVYKDKLNGKNNKENISNIQELLDISLKLYSIVDNVIDNATSCTTNEIANATDFNLAFDIAINGSNFFNIPFVTNFKYLNPHIHSNFTCKTIMVLDISNVSRDNEKNVSYFTVDSVSQSGEKYVLSNYRVEVEGTDISSEDVYAKFIAGQYSQFYKIKESNIEEYEDGENLDIGL